MTKKQLEDMIDEVAAETTSLNKKERAAFAEALAASLVDEGDFSFDDDDEVVQEEP